MTTLQEALTFLGVIAAALMIVVIMVLLIT